MLVIDGDGRRIRLHDEPATNVTRRHTVAITVKRQTEVFVHERVTTIAIVGCNRRQRPHGFRTKTFFGCLTGFAMTALIGDLLEPLASLRVDVGQVDEAAQRPEVLTHVADGALHFTFFPSSRHMTCTRNEAIFPCEAQKPGIESHEIALVFGDNSQEIVEPKLTGDAAHGFEGVDMTTGECLECLTVSELEIHLPAVTLNQAEGVELARRAVIDERPEVTPVDLKAFSRCGLHANEGAPGFRLRPHGLQVIFDNRVASSEALIA